MSRMSPKSAKYPVLQHDRTARDGRRVSGLVPLIVPRTKCRSVPQIALEVRRTIASVGSCSCGSGTSSPRMSPTSWYTTAFHDRFLALVRDDGGVPRLPAG